MCRASCAYTGHLCAAQVQAQAARAAVEQLRAAGVELDEPELGRKGEWLAYGPLLVEVEHTAPPPPPAPPPLEKDGIYPFIH